MRAADLTQAIQYRIDGADRPGVAPAEYPRWSYIGHLDGEVRFHDGCTGMTLALDRLTEVERGHLVYTPT
jgi:hypothetical protein